jgi:hypothetical protein
VGWGGEVVYDGKGEVGGGVGERVGVRDGTEGLERGMSLYCMMERYGRG